MQVRGLELSDVLGIASVILGVVSIVISVLIYRLSNRTSKRLFQDSLEAALTKATALRSDGTAVEATDSASGVTELTRAQRAKLSTSLSRLFRKSRVSGDARPRFKAIQLAVQLKGIADERTVSALLYAWRDRRQADWTGALEVGTEVTILNAGQIIEDLDSR